MPSELQGLIFPTFWLRIGSWAVLEASWRHLGPSWQKFWAVLGPQDASKMRYLGPKTAPRRDQNLPKSGPKHLPRRTWQPKTAKNLENIENGSQKSMGYLSGLRFFCFLFEPTWVHLGPFWRGFGSTFASEFVRSLPRCCTIFVCFWSLLAWLR